MTSGGDARTRSEPKAEPESCTQQTIVTEPLPNDVLLGRGSHLVKYEGNIEFRRFIQERKQDYVQATRHNHKDQIARDVISMVTSRNGRFLRKVDNPVELKMYRLSTDILSVWVLVDTDIIVEKVKQAFRDSFKDDRPKEDDQQNLNGAGFQEVAASGLLEVSNSKLLPGCNGHDANDPSTNLKATEAKAECSIKSSNPQIMGPDGPIHSNNMNPDLQSLHLQLSIQSDIARQFLHPVGHQSPHNYFQDAIPKRSQHLGNLITHSATRSMVGYEQANILRALQRQEPQQTQLQQGRNPLIDSTDVFFAIQKQANILRALQRKEPQYSQLQQDRNLFINNQDLLFAIHNNSSSQPFLGRYSAFRNNQELLNNRVGTVQFSRLLSGLTSSNVFAGHAGEHATDSTTPSERQVSEKSSTSNHSISNLGNVNNSKSVEYNSKYNRKHSVGTDLHNGDDESTMHKKMRATKHN